MESSRSKGHLLERDLQEIVRNSSRSLEALRDSRILISGATGFVGTWLTSALLSANETMNLNLEVVVISRNKERVNSRINPASGDRVRIVESNLDSLTVDRDEFAKGFTHIIHGGNSSATADPIDSVELYFESAKKTIDNLIDVAEIATEAPIFMHLSSGAVYGSRARGLEIIDENTEVQDEDPLKDPYAHMKRMNESAIEIATAQGKIQGSNPRLFSFCGPYIPLDQHFAIGNFMKSASLGQEIRVMGNPLTTRSYLYPTDLVEWLLSLLQQPSLKPIHVGSDDSLEMRDIAAAVSRAFDTVPFTTGDETVPANHYVPRTSKTRAQYDLTQRINLDEGLKRWKEWLSDKAEI